jgi:mycothiol synthase
VAPAEQDYKRWTQGRLSSPELWQVAWEGEQVAGIVLNLLDRGQSKKHRRQRGLARSLLLQSIRMFCGMGMKETALGVDTWNPSGALGLHESVGYREARRHTFAPVVPSLLIMRVTLRPNMRVT